MAHTGNQWRHKIIEEGMKETKNNEQAFLCNSQSKINAYLHLYYKTNTHSRKHVSYKETLNTTDIQQTSEIRNT